MDSKVSPTVKIDILTLLYKGERFFEDFLQAIKDLNYPKSAIRLNFLENTGDSAAYDFYQEIINQVDLGIEVNLLQSKKNLGFSGGNNYLFEKYIEDSDYPYFFLLNQDSKIDPDCFKHLADFAVKYPDAGMIEAKQSPLEHPKVYDSETFETSWCSGGGVLLKKSALKEVGFFDHKFFLYCEDVDLSWRFWKKGYGCRINPQAIYEHFTEELDQEKDHTIRYFYSFRNGILMHFKHDSIAGNLKYLVMAYLVIFKQDPVRKKAFMRAYFQAYKFLPYYLFKRIFSRETSTNQEWIIFNKFEYGERREYQDIDGRRVFI